MTNADDKHATEAIKWLDAQRTGDLSARDQTAFGDWLSDPDNSTAYSRIENAWDALGAQDDLRAEALALEQSLTRSDAPAPRRAAPMVSVPMMIAASVAVLVVGLIFVTQLSPTVPADSLSYQTQTAEVRSLELDDGSTAYLAPQSEIEVAFSDDLRAVTLVRGEIFLDVKKNDGREFTVQAGSTRVSVLGTSFNVKSNSTGVTVSVAEGRVRVVDEAKTAAAPEQVLIAGNEVKALADGLTEITTTRPEQAGAWRTGFREYRDNPLCEVIEDARAYLERDLILADEDLCDLSIAVSYRVSDIDPMLDTLAQGWGLSIDRTSTDKIIIRKATKSLGDQ